MGEVKEVYLNLSVTAPTDEISHIGLWDNNAGAEISGGDPAYSRKAVSWTEAENGVRRPTEDLVFQVPAESKVTGWRGFDASSGGTNYGGADFEFPEYFEGQGEFTLYAAGSGFRHKAKED